MNLIRITLTSKILYYCLCIPKWERGWGYVITNNSIRKSFTCPQFCVVVKQYDPSFHAQKHSYSTKISCQDSIISPEAKKITIFCYFWLTCRNCHFSPILGQRSYGENKIFGKFSQFWSGKSILQEVLGMPKANQDLGLFLGVMTSCRTFFKI